MQEIPQEETYVVWSHGAKILGISRNAFFHLVECGLVRTEAGRGEPQDDRYNLADILTLKEKGRPFGAMSSPKGQPVILDWLLPGDIPLSVLLDKILYVEDINPGETALSRPWRRSNHKLTMAAFSANRAECLAYIQLVPLAERAILDILSGQRTERSIRPDEVRTYDEPGAYALWAMSAVAHPERPDLLYRMLYKMMQFWIEQFPQRYISRVYAQAVSAQGARLIRHFLMTPLPDLSSNAYVLDMAQPSTSKTVSWFQNRLQEKALHLKKSPCP